jgi:hypothetical protein
MSPEEIAAAQKRRLLAAYEYVEGDPDEIAALNAARDPNAPTKGMSAAKMEDVKLQAERKKLLEEALRLDARNKKFKKQQEGMWTISGQLTFSRPAGTEPERGKGRTQGAAREGGCEE